MYYKNKYNLYFVELNIMSEINKTEKIIVKFTLGITFILLGLINNPKSLYASIIYIVIGLIIFPKTYNLIIDKFKVKINSALKWTLIILLFILSQSISTNEQEKRELKLENLKKISSSKSSQLAKEKLSKMSLKELKNIDNSNYFEEKKLNDNFKKLLKKYSSQYITQWYANDSLIKINHLKELEAERRWKMSKAGKLQNRHPNWSNEDCENIIKGLIWIGMDYDMVTYQRGLPNRVNTSNYGNGNEYQACWDDYDPSCFYFGENRIIKSYN
jgi:hypothetical protein